MTGLFGSFGLFGLLGSLGSLGSNGLLVRGHVPVRRGRKTQTGGGNDGGSGVTIGDYDGGVGDGGCGGPAPLFRLPKGGSGRLGLGLRLLGFWQMPLPIPSIWVAKKGPGAGFDHSGVENEEPSTVFALKVGVSSHLDEAVIDEPARLNQVV